MNNFEKIKQMTIDEICDFITELTNNGEYTCAYCKFYDDYYRSDSDLPFTCDDNCKEGVKQWLLLEEE